MKSPRNKLFFILMLAVVVGGSVLYLRSQGSANGDSLGEVTRPRHMGGQIVSLKPEAALSAPNVNTQSAVAYGATGVEPAKNGIEIYNLVYTSTDPRDNSEIKVKARVYIPFSGAANTALVFGPGTTGVAPECAPSLERARGKNWGHYDEHLGFYAGQGYITASTDYDNRDQTGTHHYFVGEVEGRAMLDLSRALANIKNPAYVNSYTKPSQVVLAGYSQGGHAALWGEHLRSSYASDVKIAGVIGYAAATDVTKLVRDSVSGTTSVWLPPYLLAGYSSYYQFDAAPSKLLNPPYAATFDADSRQCIDQLEVATGRYAAARTSPTAVYQPAFVNAMVSGNLAGYDPPLATKMQANLAGNWKSAAPVLILGGQLDAVVRPDAQGELRQRLCDAGTSTLRLQMYQNGTHYNVMALGKDLTLEWLSGKIVHSNQANGCSFTRAQSQ